MNETSIILPEMLPEIIDYSGPALTGVYDIFKIAIIIYFIIFLFRLIYLIKIDKIINKRKIIRCIIFYLIIFISITSFCLITYFTFEQNYYNKGLRELYGGTLCWIILVETIVLAIIELIINRKKKENVHRSN